MEPTFSMCVRRKNEPAIAAPEQRLWVGTNLITAADYRERERRAKLLLRELALEQSWVASQIGRTRETVCTVLNERDRLPRRRGETLYLIELLLACVEAGEVAPR